MRDLLGVSNSCCFVQESGILDTSCPVRIEEHGFFLVWEPRNKDAGLLDVSQVLTYWYLFNIFCFFKREFYFLKIWGTFYSNVLIRNIFIQLLDFRTCSFSLPMFCIFYTDKNDWWLFLKIFSWFVMCVFFRFVSFKVWEARDKATIKDVRVLFELEQRGVKESVEQRTVWITYGQDLVNVNSLFLVAKNAQVAKV